MILRFLATLGVAFLAVLAVGVAAWFAFRDDLRQRERREAELARVRFYRAPGGEWRESRSVVFDDEGRQIADAQSAYAPDPKRPVHTPGHCGCGGVHE